MIGTSWGTALAHDSKGRVGRKWDAIRRKSSQGRSRGLTGAALESAVMGIAMADPSLVKFGAR